MITVAKPALLCDTGLLSRAFILKPPFLEAYQTAKLSHLVTVSTAIFIELQHWLLIQRGLKTPITRTDYDQLHKRLDSYLVLNNDGVSEQAMKIARRWPDTGVGDSYTIATALVFDVPVFTLNPKHFERVAGLTLYKPDNYQELLRSVNRF